MNNLLFLVVGIVVSVTICHISSAHANEFNNEDLRFIPTEWKDDSIDSNGDEVRIIDLFQLFHQFIQINNDDLSVGSSKDVVKMDQGIKNKNNDAANVIVDDEYK